MTLASLNTTCSLSTVHVLEQRGTGSVTVVRVKEVGVANHSIVRSCFTVAFRQCPTLEWHCKAFLEKNNLGFIF